MELSVLIPVSAKPIYSTLKASIQETELTAKHRRHLILEKPI